MLVMLFPARPINNINDKHTFMALFTKDTVCTYAYDGFMIRLFFDPELDDWCAASMTKDDASTAFWNSDKSLSAMFWEAIQESEFTVGTLHKSMTHYFNVRHPDHIHVIASPRACVEYLYSYDGNRYIDSDTRRTLSKEFVMYLLDKDYTTFPDIRGLVTINSTGVFKYDFPFFTRFEKALGNDPNIYKRILSLMITNNRDYVKILTQWAANNDYTECIDFITDARANFNELFQDILDSYIDSHVRKSVYFGSAYLYYKILKMLHGKYMRTFMPIRVSDVETCFFELSVSARWNLLDTFLSLKCIDDVFL